MSLALAELFKFTLFTPGRRIHSLMELRRRAEARGLGDLLPVIDECIAHDREVISMQAAHKAPPPRRDARAIDVQIDRLLALLCSIVDHYAADSTDRQGATAASNLSRVLFPNELIGHIRLPHIDQLAANERVLQVLQDPANQALVQRMGLAPHTERLHTLNQAFADAVRSPDDPVSTSEVKIARSHGHELFLGVIARILGRFATPGDADARAELLQPVLEQSEAIRQYRRRRRRVVDINPDTGEPTEPDDTDGTRPEDTLDLLITPSF